MKLADVFTFFGLFAALLALVLVIEHEFLWAGILLLIAVLADWLDGRVARHLGQSRKFGMYLDSLADVCAFGFVPLAATFFLIGPNLLLYVSGAMFLSAGIFRLARYQTGKYAQSFEGMPITVNGVVLAAVLLINPGLLVWAWLYFFIVSFLMISRFRVSRL